MTKTVSTACSTRPKVGFKKAWRLLCAAFALASCASEPEPVSPPDATDHLSRARAHFAATRFEEAAAAARAGLALDSTNADLHNVLASSHAAQGRYALAIESLETTVRLKPDFAMGFVNLGGIYTKLGQYDRADTYLQRAVQLNPDNSPVRRRLGELYLATGRYAEATRELLEALRLFPNDATLYYYLGQSLAAEDRQDDALEAFQRATLLDIGFADAFYRLATLARKAGRDTLTQQALTSFTHLQALSGKEVKRLRAAILNAPEEAAHHYNLGLFFVRQGYFAQAENKFDRAVALRPGDLACSTASPATSSSCNQPEAALRYLQIALDQDPAYFPALLKAGHITGQLRRYDEAVTYCRRAVAARPDDAEGWHLLGFGPVQQGGTRRGRTGIAAQPSTERGRRGTAH